MRVSHLLRTIVGITTAVVLIGCGQTEGGDEKNEQKISIEQTKQPITPGAWNIVSAAGGLALRSSNSTSGPVIRMMARCNLVYVYGVDYGTGMAHVRYNYTGETGYANKDYLTAGTISWTDSAGNLNSCSP